MSEILQEVSKRVCLDNSLWVTASTMLAISDEWDKYSKNRVPGSGSGGADAGSFARDALSGCSKIPLDYRSVASHLGIQQFNGGTGSFEKGYPDELFFELMSLSFATGDCKYSLCDSINPATIGSLVDLSLKVRDPENKGDIHEYEIAAAAALREYAHQKKLIQSLPFKARDTLAKAGLYPEWFLEDSHVDVVRSTISAPSFDAVYLRNCQTPDTEGCRSILAGEKIKWSFLMLNDPDPSVVKAAISGIGTFPKGNMPAETVAHLDEFTEPIIVDFYNGVRYTEQNIDGEPEF